MRGVTIRVATVEELPSGASRRVVAGKWEISVFNVGGTFRAVKDSCPHQMVSLCGGSVDGTVLTCPGHAWKFDLSDGRCLEGDPELTLKSFPVTVKEGVVHVEV
jgi:nitrite reductase/ring-hydroxylating ferredoxin subunit